MSKSGYDKLRRQFTREISNFLELSSEIRRNKNDSKFTENGGQIIYCFDATVFSMFFDTNDWKYAVQTFNNSPWSNSDPKHWENIQTQSAMVAAEYLLSDGLPGAKHDKVFLTPWHLDELGNRLHSVSQTLSSDSRTSHQRNEKIREELHKKAAFLSLKTDRERARFDLSDDSLTDDVKVLKESFRGVSLDRYAATRNAATLLTNCEESEKFDQIHRILSSEVQERMGSLLELFDSFDDDTSTLRTEAVNWYYRLSHAFGLRDRYKIEKNLNPSKRRKSGIWNDAQSLALCQFISDNRLNENQKIAFVTSDQQLFRAYAEWWATARSSQEFILRQSIQFTPIFNFSDVSSDLKHTGQNSAEVEDIFRKIEAAVESTLLPFNLASVSDYASSSRSLSQHRGREHLAAYARAHRSSETDPVLDFFFRGIGEEWFLEKIQDFKDTSDLWRKLERISVGFFSELVSKRLEDDALSISASSSSNLSDRYSKSAIGFISKALDSITSSVRSNSIPIALSYLKSNFSSASGFERRVPATIWYKIQDSFIVNDMFLSFERKLGNPDFEAALVLKPEAHFVLAAGAALHVRDWWTAVEFAEQAVVTAKTHKVSEKALIETLFVAAASMRFKLGSISPKSWNEEDSISREKIRDQCFQRATELLIECEKVEREMNDRCLAKARIKSEFGALNLFRATSIVVQRKSKKHADKTLDVEADRYLGRARTSLEHGLSILPAKELVSKHEFYDAVKLHILHNLAGVEVLRFLLAPNEFRPLDSTLSQFHGESERLALDVEKVPALSAEWLVFCLIYGYADLKFLPKLEKILGKSREDSSLSLDWELSDLISSNIGAITSYCQSIDPRSQIIPLNPS